jgi:uncharacterized protein
MMDERISNFLKAQSVFAFCTSVQNEPHCVSCMYAFREDRNMLLFSSDRSTKHIANALLNPKIAGTVLPFKMELAIMRGVQFTGTFSIPEGADLEEAQKIYYRKYPMAHLMKGEIWSVQLETIKMTDRTLGFGKKICWEQSAPHEL